MKLAAAGALAIAALSCATPAPSPPKPSVHDGWAPMSFVDKHEVMTFTVLPELGRAFMEFKGAKVAKLRCTSCHGANAEAVHYQMPNGLDPLDPDDMPKKSDGPMPAFMIDTVLPQMKEITGDPTLTCFSCHAKRTGPP